MNAKHENVEGSAHLAADLIMGHLHPEVDIVARATALMDRRALEAHQQISGVDRHWQIAIHLWPALKSVAHHTGQISGHLLAAGVDAHLSRASPSVPQPGNSARVQQARSTRDLLHTMLAAAGS